MKVHQRFCVVSKTQRKIVVVRYIPVFAGESAKVFERLLESGVKQRQRKQNNDSGTLQKCMLLRRSNGDLRNREIQSTRFATGGNHEVAALIGVS